MRERTSERRRERDKNKQTQKQEAEKGEKKEDILIKTGANARREKQQGIAFSKRLS